MRGERAVGLSLTILLVLSACSGSSDTDSGTESAVGGGSGSTTSAAIDVPADVPADVAALLAADFDVVPGDLVVEPTIVERGDTVSVSGLAGMTGTVAMYGPDGSVSDFAIDGDGAALEVPMDAALGLHLVMTETPEGLPAAATFRVADGPFVALSLVRDKLVVEQRGVEPGSSVGIMVGSGDDVRFYEAGAGGLLLPVSRQPTASIEDYLGVDLELPPAVEGEVTLVVEREDGSSLSSNAVMLVRCESDPVVVGDLGGSGEVRAVWTGAGAGSAAVDTDDGQYRLDVGPGLVAVTEYPADGDPQITVVRARCGQEHEVGDAGAEGEGFAADGLVGDVWIGRVSGAEDLTVDEGVVTCTADGDTMEIGLFDELDFSIGLGATIDGFDGTGSYGLTGFVLGGAGGFAEGWFSFEIDADTEGVLTGTFTGDATLESGDIDYTGAFRCLVGTYGGFDGSGAPGGTSVSFQSGSDHEQCRVGQVVTTGPGAEVARVLARRLAAGSPLIDWYTSDDITAMLAAAAADQQASGDGSDDIEAVQRVVSGDYYVTVTIREFPESIDRRYWAILKALDVERGTIIARAASSGPDLDSLSTIPNSGVFIEAVGRSGICGYVDPVDSTVARGETQQLTYEVVDLIDVPVFDAEVTVADREDGRFASECGSFDRLGGASSDGFETTFTAAEQVEQDCSEFPRFSATSGDLTTRAERERGDATVHVGSKWEYEATLVAPTPNGPLIWRSGSADEPGVFYVRESGAIVGGGSGTFDGARSCEVYENDVLTFKESPVDVSGKWLSYLSGSLVDDEYFDFRFDGNAWQALAWPPIPDECWGLAWGPLAGTSSNDPFEGIARLFGYRLDIGTVYPVRLTPQATTVTFTVDMEGFPDAELVMTIRPAEAEAGG